MTSFLPSNGIDTNVIPPSGLSEINKLTYTCDRATDREALRQMVAKIKDDNPYGYLKAGQCFEDRKGVRPFNPTQYPSEVFRSGALLVLTGMLTKDYAEHLENVLIELLGDRGVEQQVRLEVRSERND